MDKTHPLYTEFSEAYENYKDDLILQEVLANYTDGNTLNNFIDYIVNFNISDPTIDDQANYLSGLYHGYNLAMSKFQPIDTLQ